MIPSIGALMVSLLICISNKSRLAWGYRAAQHIHPLLVDHSSPDPDDIPPWQDTGYDAADPALVSQDMTSIKNIMWNYVGLVRTTPRLRRALSDLANLEFQVEDFYRVSRLTDGLIGLRNAVRTAIVVTTAAWKNKRSMGAHYRE